MGSVGIFATAIIVAFGIVFLSAYFLVASASGSFSFSLATLLSLTIILAFRLEWHLLLAYRAASKSRRSVTFGLRQNDGWKGG